MIHDLMDTVVIKASSYDQIVACYVFLGLPIPKYADPDCISITLFYNRVLSVCYMCLKCIQENKIQ